MATLGRALSTLSVVVGGVWFAACSGNSGGDLAASSPSAGAAGESAAGGGEGVGGAIGPAGGHPGLGGSSLGGSSAGGHPSGGHAGVGGSGVAGANAGHGGTGGGVGGAVGHGGAATGGAGTGGEAGTGGASAGHPTGGVGGVGGGAAGKGGASAGSAGAQTAGNGGVAGAKGGAAGAGGAACTGCDDGVACTVDACTANGCSHTADSTLCQGGQICDPLKGCIAQTICSSDATCTTALGSDACKVDIHCNKATATCAYDTLDSDGDGFPPVVCGGTDCDDSSMSTHPGAIEICDGKDNDCNGKIDDGATCPGTGTCEMGACVCPPASSCNGTCVDLTSDPENCGGCGVVCPGTATCHASTCECPSGEKDCGGTCVNVMVDPDNCNGCGLTCGSKFSCESGMCTCPLTTCGAACVDTTSDNAHCGGCNTVCPATATCEGSFCVCPSGQSDCAVGGCVDETSDPKNCGGCGIACASGICKGSNCQTCPTTDILILQDLSGSMETGEINPTVAGSPLKVVAAHDALKQFIVETGLNGMDVGIGYFPFDITTPTTCTTSAQCITPGITCCGTTCCNAGQCVNNGFGGVTCNAPAGGPDTASCNLADYPGTPVAPALMPGNEAALGTSIDSHLVTNAPGGGTTPQALQGELAYAEQWRTNHPGHNVVVVVLSDGVPNDCTSSLDLATDWLPSVTADEATLKMFFVELGNGSDCGCATSYPTEYMKLSAAAGTTYFTPRLSTVDIKTALDTILGQVTCK